jgi:hypothetical protein
MTTLFRKFAAASLVLAWFFLPSIGNAAACTTSLASLNGWYALLVSGTNAAGTTNEYLTGAVLFDGAGNLSGSNIYSGTGTVSAITGTYSLNTDCSLTLTTMIGAAAQAFTVGVRSSTNEAVGVEVDAGAVATIDLQAQYSTYTPGLNFTGSSANGTFAANCINFLTNASVLNLVTFANGTIAGTAAYNDGGSTIATANSSYSGTYSVNSDGTFVGSVVIQGTPLGVYGVLSNVNSEIEYIYTTTSGNVISPYAACTGALAPATTPSFSLPTAAAGVSVAQGTSGTDGISVTGANGFTGSVSFSASGLPAGATAAFSPATSTTGTTLTLTAASSTPTGIYPITIIGTSGTLTETAPVTLTVTAMTSPGFSLSPASTTLTLPQNMGGTDGITVTPANGFTGAVSLAVSGLPSGATGAFAGTTLVIFPAIGTAVGNYKLTITGTSGSTTASTAVNLVITPGASFVLSPSAGSVSVAAGKSVTDAISITSSNGFNAAVSFSASGLPAGVTAAFSPASSSSATTLTLTAAATTVAGSYPIVISGTTSGSGASNGIKQTAPVTLVVGSSTSSPGFLLSAASGTLTLPQNMGGTDGIVVTSVNGFSGAVSLAVSGLPSGVSSAFSGDTLVIFVSASAAPGSYALKITGTSGTTTATTAITLVITAEPKFSLSPAASKLAVARLSGASDVIAVVAANGFTGAVTFKVTGLPAGVTGRFSPSSSTSKTVFSIAAAFFTPPGTYTITITGTSAGSNTSNPLTEATTISLHIL